MPSPARGLEGVGCTRPDAGWGAHQAADAAFLLHAARFRWDGWIKRALPPLSTARRARCAPYSRILAGNICRSPTAEATFTTVVERAGLAGQFSIDSCGTGGGSGNWWQKGGFSYHEGEAADARVRGVRCDARVTRASAYQFVGTWLCILLKLTKFSWLPQMTEAAAKRGVKLTSRSRPLTPEDLQTFDYIVCMDQVCAVGWIAILLWPVQKQTLCVRACVPG